MIKIVLTFIFLTINFSLAANSTYQAALEKNYPNPKCLSKKEIVYLTNKQKKKIEEISGTRVLSKLKVRYNNRCNNSVIYIDSHIVRTLNETLLFEIKEGKIEKLETVSFMEPQEYKSPNPWIKKFIRKKLDEKLQLNADIDALSGATLTAVAVTNASRKILALHQVINEEK